MAPDLTPDFDAFVAPARARPAVWRLLLGLVLMVAVYAAVVFAAFALAPALPGDQVRSGASPLSLTLMFGTFGGAVLGVMLAVRLLHARSPATLFGPVGRVWRQFALAVAVFAVCQGVNLLVWSWFYDAVPQRGWDQVLAWLPLAAGLVLVQTAAEELVFRGYILQQLAARFRSPLIWLALPPVLFAVLHYDPATNGRLNLAVVVMIGVTGLAWADLTRISGSIGAAWGWHFANNLFLLVVLGNAGQMDGFVAQSTPYAITDMPLLPILTDLVTQVAIWLVLRRMLLRSAAI